MSINMSIKSEHTYIHTDVEPSAVSLTHTFHDTEMIKKHWDETVNLLLGALQNDNCFKLLYFKIKILIKKQSSNATQHKWFVHTYQQIPQFWRVWLAD
jgi:hypothetical protein